MRLLPAAVLVTGALLFAGCSDDETTTPVPPHTTETSTPATTAMPGTTTVTDGEWSSCQQEELGVTVPHPEGWSVNEDHLMAPCSLFDPQPFEVPIRGEIPLDIAVSLTAQQVPFDQIVGDDPSAVELSRREATVAGFPAVRQELRSTGLGLIPEGHEHTQWAIDVGVHVLMLQTHATPDADPPYAEAQEVLDRMVALLEIDTPSPDPTTTIKPPDGSERPVGLFGSGPSGDQGGGSLRTVGRSAR
jgi:hypothetical protein